MLRAVSSHNNCFGKIGLDDRLPQLDTRKNPSL